MKIAIPKEVTANERRVACTPDETVKLIALGFAVTVERGAGDDAGYSDGEYENAGAVVVTDADALWKRADIILKVHPPVENEIALLTAGKILISFFWAARNENLRQQLAAQGATVLAMDAVPRISRAQKMDALSSMANIAGYRAVVEAAQHFGRFFAGQITAAGRIPPAKVLVIGAGVAGLSAIGTAVGLGAAVRAFDTRREVKEQIESLNAEFLLLEFDEDGAGHGGYAKTMSAEFINAEMALFAAQAREVDIIITTALIPGKPAPTLITAPMVATMKTGGVIVDLAAEQGGNCELTERDAVVRRHGVTIVGHTDFPSRMAMQASALYAANVRHLIAALTPEKNGETVIDLDDQVIRATTIMHNGENLSPPPAPSPPPSPKPATVTPSPSPSQSSSPSPARKSHKFAFATVTALLVGAGAILALGNVAPPAFMNHFIVFVLSCFVGWQVVWRVAPALHTPLMSVTNAISSIIVIGALLQTDSPFRWLALVALLLASVNIAGGFWVTQRMLQMFRK